MLVIAVAPIDPGGSVAASVSLLEWIRVDRLGDHLCLGLALAFDPAATAPRIELHDTVVDLNRVEEAVVDLLALTVILLTLLSHFLLLILYYSSRSYG